MIKIGDKIKIDSDLWEDVGKIYEVISCNTSAYSTALSVEVKDDIGDIVRRVIPKSWVIKA